MGVVRVTRPISNVTALQISLEQLKIVTSNFVLW